MPTGRKKQGGEQRSSKDSQQAKDLKQREYRDSDGNVHHHTHKWMADHAKSGKSESGSRSREDESEE
jgi:hypothetical protein